MEKLKKGASAVTSNELLKQFAKDATICAIVVVALLTFIKPTIVNQTSMLPTCKPGDYILLEKMAYAFHKPERGDIIVFRSELKEDNSDKGKLLIKRIVGLPGEHIEIRDGVVLINGEYLDEGAYLNENVPTTGNVDLVIPKGHYFAMGDNRPCSIDSRSDDVGTVPKKAIYGKAAVRLFPLKSAGFVK